MKKFYLLIIAFLCVSVLSLHAKESKNRVVDFLPFNQSAIGLLCLDDQQHDPFVRMNPGQLYRLQPVAKQPIPNFKSPHAPDASVVLLDSTVSTAADGTYRSKTVYGYNARGKRVLASTFSYDSQTQQWTNTNKTEYEYDANDEQILQLNLEWNTETASWITLSRVDTEWERDSENNRTFVRTSQSWNNDTQSLKFTSREVTVLHGNTNYYKYRTLYRYDAEGNWMPNSKLEQLYDVEGYEVSITNYTWNQENNKWKGSSKQAFTNSADESYTELLANYSWSDEMWDWSDKVESEFDYQGTEIAVTVYRKNGAIWDPVSKTGKEGDFTVFYEVKNNAFVKTYKENTEYDANGNMSYYSLYLWDGTKWCQSRIVSSCIWDNLSGEWRIIQYIEYGYNVAGQELYHTQLYRSNSQSEWTDNYNFRYENTYDDFGRQTERKTYKWAGGEPAFYASAFSEGTYKAIGESYYNQLQEWDVKIVRDATVANKVWITNLVEGGSSEASPVYGMLNDNTTELKIPVHQVAFASASYDVFLTGFYGPDGEVQIPDDGFITAQIREDGSILIVDEFGSAAFSKEDGTLAGWYNIFKSNVVLTPAVKQPGELTWNYNWTETNRSTYYYSEHTTTVGVPSYEVKTQVFPNPAGEYLTVSGTRLGQTITITGINGAKIGTYTAAESSTVIPISSLSSGMYFVSIDSFKVKIIKK